ncbi:RDD family protein [Streptantibioticus silvisoli]|uniref:RDD family protein n=1 Tax=Streptantibioticus silvisoli TaxID=2705255 RepID=A0ABT6W5F6_9ACTN|nr:RDD family protein [Streptantibioticus silvisoli]MDI5965997.1 RDD family protein [Streptantibioticus silvisoli]
MSTEQPPPGSGDQPQRDPFGKRPDGSPSGPPESSWPAGPAGPGGGTPPYGSPPGGTPPYGAPPPGGTPPPYGPPPPGQPYGPGMADPLAGMPPLANRGKRLVARIIDALLIGVPLGVIMYFAFGGFGYNANLRSFWQDLVYGLVYFAYDGYMLTTRGQTVGKMAMRIRVALLDNGATPVGSPGWTRAAVYALPPIVPCCGSVFWLVNVVWCLWDRPYHQCLHDKAAKTVVVEATR